ncbi:hypothetical protein BVRB_032160 [Beta vulgaris subsp. vulgaris]|uniref:CBM56 domain-containing protein n=1 Tax=Beta vulgaris subsp. vulgaris TaxID=3555 RepID=A0A0J8AX83_BETVV|nr:hypothetical protein BVRB_032160 [Beta vulgaris subsp. vulgaris]
MQPSYELTFPMYLALGAGESFTYWFTTASTSAAYPREWACDSASFSFTTPGTPNPAPAQPNPSAVCPSVAFDHAIERIGAGQVAGTSVYAITFASATPGKSVSWVDVHIHANSGFFNYRMEVGGTGFKQILPSPHLNLAIGATVEYWFTYEAGGVACDTATYSVEVGSVV